MAHDLVSWHEEMMVGKCVLGFIVLHNIKVPCLHQLYLARICILGYLQLLLMQLQRGLCLLCITNQGLCENVH